MSPRRRKAKRPRTAKTLAPEWRRWVAENLLQGAEPEKVRAALREQGVPEAEAKRRVEEILASPLLGLARDQRRRAERLEQVLRLLRAQQATRSEPASVERVAGLDAEAFFERYYATSTPVVLTDYMDGWPALERWAPARLAERFADVEIEVCEGREGEADYDVKAMELTARATMGDFVRRVLEAGETNDLYMIARNRNLEGPLSELFDDLRLERGILARERLRGGCQLWLGPAGTVTPLHHDTSNILFCQVHGTKRVTLAAPVESALLRDARAMYARLDPERDDPGEVTLRRVELGPGDALFIPVGWWHHVRALEVAVSIAFVAFTRDNERRWYCPGKIR